MRLCYGLLLVFLAACGSSTSSYNSSPPPPPGPPGPPPPPPAPTTRGVTIADYSYAPDSILVSMGTPVQWTNEGSFPHTVTSDNGAFPSSVNLAGRGTDPYGNPTPGGTYTRTFSTAGTFPYHCGIHATMRGKVVVNP